MESSLTIQEKQRVEDLFIKVANLIETSRAKVVSTVNLAEVYTKFEIGRYRSLSVANEFYFDTVSTGGGSQRLPGVVEHRRQIFFARCVRAVGLPTNLNRHVSRK